MSRLRFSKLSANDRGRIIAAIRAGESVSSIAKAFSVSRRTVYNYKAQAEETELRSRTSVLTVRLNKADIEALDDLARKQGLSRAEAARRTLLRATDVFQPEERETEALKAIGLELAKIGSNLNQVSNAINAEKKFGGLKSSQKLEAALEQVDDWSREVHFLTTQVRSKIIRQAERQRLRNAKIFELLGADQNVPVEPQGGPPEVAEAFLAGEGADATEGRHVGAVEKPGRKKKDRSLTSLKASLLAQPKLPF